MLLKNIYLAAFAAVLFIGFFFRKNGDDSRSKAVDLWFCVTAALIASTFLSLFPLSREFPYADSSVFIYIGKMMHKGFLPYKDLFDHKGILMYFIQYVGLLIGNGSWIGIWVLEAVNMIVTAWLLFKISRIFTKDKIVRYLSVVAVLVMCGMQTYEGGNFTEEYALPWISLALYIFLKYFQNFTYVTNKELAGVGLDDMKDSCSFRDIVWLGAGFAVVSLLRVNMASIWIAVMPVILIRMIFKQQWKKLGSCALGFICGLAIVYVPVLLYLLITGSLQDFIDCYIIFNFGYSEAGGNWGGVWSAILKGLANLPFAVAAFFISLWPNIKKRLYVLNLWILVVTLYFSHMSGRFYQHYGMILLPMLVPLFACSLVNLYEIFSLKGKIKLKWKFPGKAIMLTGLTVVIAGAFFLQFKWSNLIHDSLFQTDGMDVVQEYILANSGEEDDVLIVGNDVKHYLLAGRSTENKYFYQTPPIKISDEVYRGFMDELNRCQSDLIVVMGNKTECLERDDNLGRVYQYFEEQGQKGKYECEVYENFYAYRRSEGE